MPHGQHRCTPSRPPFVSGTVANQQRRSFPNQPPPHSYSEMGGVHGEPPSPTGSECRYHRTGR
eukprot:4781182-Alexandrium_andersonii.AAC.1